MDTSVLSRRALLGASGAAIAVVAAPPARAVGGGVSPALLDLVEAKRRTFVAEAEYYERVLEPMNKNLSAALEAVPHEKTKRTVTNIFGVQRAYNTKFSVPMARLIVRDPLRAEAEKAVAQEVIGLAEARDARIARIRDEHREREIEATYDELGHADTRAGNAIALFPAASVADLLTKLRWICDNDWWEMDEATNGIAADVERLQVAQVLA